MINAAFFISPAGSEEVGATVARGGAACPPRAGCRTRPTPCFTMWKASGTR